MTQPAPRRDRRRTATPAQRFILWLAQEGKCALCQQEVGDEFEVDHIQEHAHQGATKLWNLQVVCLSCHAEKTRLFLRVVKARVIWRAYVEEHSEQPTLVGRMPTGYGKTESFLDAYEVLRRQRGYTHCLIIVPTGTQEDQYAESLMDKAKVMGIPLTGVISATSTGRTIRAFKEHRAEIFVVTIQRILASLNGHN